MKNEFHLPWLFGQCLRQVEPPEFDRWVFTFANGGSIVVECPWRLLHDGSIVISSADHGHKYGLPQPLNAASEISRLLADQRIEAVAVDGGTADLHITFASQYELQILPLSIGYEAWQSFSPDGYQGIAQGGGQLSGVRA